jgi:hypothetical protein
MKSTSIIKHNLMRAAMTLALIVTCAAAWAQNPNLADYTFTTGQDASKWITLSGNATQMIGSKVDDGASVLTNIGFDFPFGDGTYSQFWTSSNGILSFNSVQADSRNWQFYSYNNEYQANQPKICGISADMSTGNNGYVKYELTGTEPNRVLVCEFFLYGVNFSTNYAATIKWQVQLHEADAKVVMVYGDALNSVRNNQIGLSQSGSDIWTINPETHEAIHSTGAVGTTYGSWPGANRYYEFNPPVPFTNNGDGTYTIGTATGWDVFCDMLADGESFSGKTVNLGANITVTRMAGIYNATTNDGHAFSGAFNGQNYTLTFTCTAANNYVAPFAYLSGTSAAHASISDLNVVTNITATDHRHIAGLVALHKGNVDVTNCHAVVNLNATVGDTNPSDLYPAGLVSQTDSSGRLTISNCTTTGTIATDGKYAAGLVGVVQGTDTIEDCVSSVTINSSTAGDGTHGGLVAVTQTNSTTTIEGCLFNGKLLTKYTTDTLATGNCGGILGWKNANVTIKNTLYAPAALVDEEHEVVAGTGNHPSGTFYRGNVPTLTNCYYTRTLHNAQGKQAHSITAGENVTVDYAGTPTNTYATSGITTYATGIKYNNVLYAGNEDNVSLTVTNTPPQGSLFMGYTVSPEGTTLNGNNPYTLTMPDENVTIGAVIKDPVTYLDENGVQQTKQPSEYTILTNTMTDLGSEGQETWYVADGTLNFNQTINVNGVVHLILKDNAVMNVGTEQNPISDSGISAEGPSISIYGQSTGSDIGQLYVYANYCGIDDYDWGKKNNDPTDDYAVTINGGYIYLSSVQYGIQSKKVTINGGQVSATAGLSGIASYPNAITLGWTSPYDLIYADAYQGDVIVKSGKAFIHSDYPPEVVTGTVSDYSLINGKFLRPAVAVTLNDGITAGSGIISSGENLYAQVGQTVTVNASSVPAHTGYAVSGITVTPTVTVTDNHDGTYSFTVPAADVTVNATIELQPVSVNYLDENGVQYTVDALPLLGGEATTLAAGWYVVNSDISYTGTVTLVGSVNLILADDCHMNIGTNESRINAQGIRESYNGPTLTIYGQSTGDHMGTLGVYTSAYSVPAICTFALTINGGHVIANTNRDHATAISTSWQPITINGGIVEAIATGNNAYAIQAGDNFTYAGGTLTTFAASRNAIYAVHKHYTFTWRNPNDSITIGSTGLYAPDNNYIATFNKLFTDGTNIYSGTLTGSELNVLAGKTLHPVTAYKTIAAHSTPGQSVSGWYLIASPVGDVSATAVNNLITTESDYDLYYFDQTGETNGLEWKNYKAHHEDATNPFNALVSGQGYLYANSANVNLIFTGTPYSGEGTFNLERSDSNDIDENMRGWNLMGNPFAETANVDRSFYVMNDGGSEIIAAERTYAEPMEGIFVYAQEEGSSVTFIPVASSQGRAQKPEPEQVVLNLSHNGGSVIDRAIVRMGEGGTLPKFQIRESSTKLYIPQDGKEYAIAFSDGQGEMPVNFKAKENGTYTITVNPQGVEMSYLHLIDNMTGADIDLIPSLRAERSNPEQPVSYTFTAKTTDYESRFKLVFIANDASTGSASDATFAFVSNGNLIVNGEGTLQVIDLMGRVIRTVGLSQCGSRTSTAGMTPCVYVLRLINGDNVRTQKIVIP